jgi:hypothetical protein
MSVLRVPDDLNIGPLVLYVNKYFEKKEDGPLPVAVPKVRSLMQKLRSQFGSISIVFGLLNTGTL